MEAVSEAVSGTMDLQTAIHEVMKTSIVHDGLVKGLRECAKALDRREALLCILAGNCNEASYVKLVEALCSQHQIPLIKVEDNKKLGEWSGMCKLDKDGKPRKVVAASCVVIKDYGKETPALDVVKGFMKVAAA